jgi:hypothetical protein
MRERKMPEKEQNTEQEQKDVPYTVHKEIVALLDRHNRRLTYTLVFLITAIFLAIFTCIWLVSQCEISTETITIDSREGAANYVGGDGSINEYLRENSGENQSYQKKNHQEEEGNSVEE